MGRNLDYEFSYGEEVTVTPRNYPFAFLHGGTMESHYAMIGMAFVAEGYPLYYDAVNEKGLGMAGLNFVGNAVYRDAVRGKDAAYVAQFELIPWILGRCGSVREAKAALSGMAITGTPFSPQLPTAQLHWMIADREACIVVESTEDGLHIYDNPVGVLTNNPPFPMQLFALTTTPVYPAASRRAYLPGGWGWIYTAGAWAAWASPGIYPASPDLSGLRLPG